MVNFCTKQESHSWFISSDLTSRFLTQQKSNKFSSRIESIQCHGLSNLCRKRFRHDLSNHRFKMWQCYYRQEMSLELERSLIFYLQRFNKIDSKTPQNEERLDDTFASLLFRPKPRPIFVSHLYTTEETWRLTFKSTSSTLYRSFTSNCSCPTPVARTSPTVTVFLVVILG